MSAQRPSLSQRIDTLQARERVLLFVASLALLYVLAEVMFIGPIAKEQRQLNNQIADIQTELSANQTEISTLATQVQSSGAAAQRAQILSLQQQIDLLNGELSTLTGGMVRAEHLPRILEDVLVKTGNLTLQKLSALPVEELQLAATNERGEPVKAGVFKHSVRLTLEGRYFDVITYLKALEALPWGFNWEELDYKVTTFPNADVELQVYTLTTEEGLFGG